MRADRDRSPNPDRLLALEYLNSLEHQRRLSPATLRNYAHALNLLFALLEESPLKDLEGAQVRRFVALLHGSGLSPRSLALTLSAWRGCFRWLVKHRSFNANPVLGIRAPKPARPLPKALSVEAAQQLLGAAEEDSISEIRDLAMFELLYS